MLKSGGRFIEGQAKKDQAEKLTKPDKIGKNVPSWQDCDIKRQKWNSNIWGIEL